jgi:hypothetical protein
MKALKDTLT